MAAEPPPWTRPRDASLGRQTRTSLREGAAVREAAGPADRGGAFVSPQDGRGADRTRDGCEATSVEDVTGRPPGRRRG